MTWHRYDNFCKAELLASSVWFTMIMRTRVVQKILRQLLSMSLTSDVQLCYFKDKYVRKYRLTEFKKWCNQFHFTHMIMMSFTTLNDSLIDSILTTSHRQYHRALFLIAQLRCNHNLWSFTWLYRTLNKIWNERPSFYRRLSRWAKLPQGAIIMHITTNIQTKY